MKGRYQIEEITIEKGKVYHLNSGSDYILLFTAAGGCRWTEKAEKTKKAKKEMEKTENMEKTGICRLEELICMKPRKRLRLESAGGGKQAFQVVLLKLHPNLLVQLSDEETNLKAGFEHLEEPMMVVLVKSSAAMLSRNLIRRQLECRKKADSMAVGASIYERGMLSMLVVIWYRALLEGEKTERRKNRPSFQLDDLFAYIREHLTDDLTLDDLERHLYVSKYHIAREFKKQTGDTIHHYIVKARLDLCRQYLAQGMPSTLVYRVGGFGGYNHFFRAFKQEYGMTPKEYYKNLSNGLS